MGNPTQGDVHVNRVLTNISIAYMQDPEGFVADRVFPNIPVSKQSDRYMRYDRSDFWRNQFEKRAAGTESAGGGWKIDNTPTYFAHVWALHKDIEDQVRANQDEPIDMDRDATIWLSQQALISREVNWASAFFTTGLWAGVTGSAQDVTGVTASPGANQVVQWNDANSTPVADIKTYSTSMQVLTGLRPNKLVIGRQVWDKLSEHPDFQERIKYSSSNDNPAIVTRRAVAAMMELEEILIMEGIQATSPENPDFETSMTTAFIAGKKALLLYVPRTPSLMTPSAGYTFSWTGYLSGQGRQGQVISTYRMDLRKSDRVEAEMAYDQKLVCADCGIFFEAIVN